MTHRTFTWLGFVLVAGWACGGSADAGGNGAGDGGDAVAALTAACESQRGIGYLKREHGENYCECWVAKAREVLADDNYRTLVEAARAELRAADEADREAIAREHTTLYSTVASAASSCKAAD